MNEWKLARALAWYPLATLEASEGELSARLSSNDASPRGNCHSKHNSHLILCRPLDLIASDMVLKVLQENLLFCCESNVTRSKLVCVCRWCKLPYNSVLSYFLDLKSVSLSITPIQSCDLLWLCVAPAPILQLILSIKMSLLQPVLKCQF